MCNTSSDMKLGVVLLIPYWQEFLMDESGKNNDRDILKLIY